MSDARVDCDGDLWEPGPEGFGWVCGEHPECWVPNLDVLERIWGPLTDPYEED